MFIRGWPWFLNTSHQDLEETIMQFYNVQNDSDFILESLFK